MKKRTKIAMIVMSLCLVITLGVFGIFAVKTLNMSVGGNITFSADGILASISKGTLAGGSFVTAGDADTKMKAVEVTTNKTEAQLNTELASWQGLNLVFAESGADVTITFTITNNSTKTNDYIDVTTTIDNGTAVNAYADVSPSRVVIDPGATQTFVVKLAVVTTEINASLTNFVVDFALTKTDTKADYSNLTFNVGNASNATSFPTTSYTVGSVIETLPTPTAPDKTFDGWYTDAQMTQKVEFPYTITADTKLYAKYVEGSLTSASYVYDEASDSYHVVRNTTAGYTYPEIVVIPDMFSGAYGTKPVTKIVDGTTGSTVVFGLSTTIKEIYVGNNVTYIGAMAFRQISTLEKVVIPDSVVEMGAGGYQFTMCTNLKEVVLSKNLKEIPIVCFGGSGIENLDFIVGENTVAKNQAFYLCENLTDVTIPQTLVEVGAFGFAKCANLTNVNMHSNLTLSNAVFWDTPYENSMKNQIISYYDQPDSKVLVKADIATITDTSQIPGYETITAISGSAFSNVVDGSTLDNTTLKTVNFPNVTEINGAAFYRCAGITSVSLPKVETIGMAAFYKCTSITTVDIPETETLGYGAFQNCRALTSINMPNVKYLGPYSLAYTTKWAVTLHEGIIWMGDQAIGHSPDAKVTTITIPSTVVQMGGTEYVGPNNENNIIGCIFYNVSPNYLTEFVVAEGNQHFVTHEGVLYTKDYKYLVSYPSARNVVLQSDPEVLAPYEIPDGCINAFISALCRMHKVKKLIVPNSFEFRRVNNLDNKFYENESIHINNMSVASYNYISVEEIELKADNPNYKTVDGIVYTKDGKEVLYVPTAKARNQTLTFSDECEIITTIPFYYKDTSTTTHNGVLVGARPSEIVIGENIKTISQAALDAINSYTWTITSNSPYYTVNSEGKLVKA